MSIGLDKMYVNMISGRLEKFSWSRDRLATCRCPFCGDSQKSARKRRFYIYQDTRHNKDHLSVICHNCGHSSSFYKFLEDWAQDIFPAYRLDLFREKGYNPERKKVDMKALGRGMVQKAQEPRVTPSLPVVSPPPPPKLSTPSLGANCPRLSELPYDHPTVGYVAWRKIPEKQWDRLFHTDRFYDLVQELEMDIKEDSELPNDRRLVIPFFDANNELVALQGRAMSKDAGIRYITIKKNENSQKLFGFDKLDTKRTPLIVEGPIDSLFLPNCVATADANLLSAGLENGIYVPDNQPRNRGVVASIGRIIAAGKRVVLWPDSLMYKDINDMVKDGEMSVRDIVSIIAENNYQGLRASAKFMNWKKV